MSGRRNIFAWLLLAITVLLLLPREQWHGLGHDEHAEHITDGPTVSATCAQCDGGWPVAVAAEALALPGHELAHCVLPEGAVRGTSLGFSLLAADRGPPTLV